MAESSESAKQAVIRNVKTENQIANARELITTTQVACFEKCVPKPGASLSSSESTCVSSCLEKYMEAWNVVNSTFVARIRQDSQQNRFG